MARPAPNDPEVLAAMVAALQAVAENAQADEFERAVGGGLRTSGVDQAVAGRLVGRFNRLNPSVRRAALGDFADRGFQRASRSVPGGREGGGRGEGWRGGGGTVFSGWPVRVRDERAPITEEVATDHEPVAEPATYAIYYEGLVAEAETNWDGFSNSDEVYSITSAVTVAEDGTNTVRTERHPTDRASYEDVDRGETRLGPVAQCWQGTLLPVSLSVIAYEHDYGDPDKYRDEVDAIVKAAIAALIYLYPPAGAAAAVLQALTGSITDGINWLLDTGDDQIDITRTQIFDQAQLELLGKRPLGQHIYVQTILGTLRTFSTPLYAHFYSTHSGSGAKYVFGFKLERNPPFVVEEGPFL